MSAIAAYPFRGFRRARFAPTVRHMRLAGVFPWVAVLLVMLAATKQISLDGAMAGWESLAAKLATLVQ